MKKMSIFVLALAVVFAFGTVVMADNDLSGNLEETIDLHLVIGKYAEVGFLADGPFELIYDEPRTNAEFGEDQVAVFIPFNVKTNTGVNVHVTENMTAGLMEELGEEQVWPSAEVPGEGVVAPYLTLANEDQGFLHVEDYDEENNAWFAEIYQEAGTSMNYNVFVENKWLSEEGNWWELIAGTYEYIVTATVSAP